MTVPLPGAMRVPGANRLIADLPRAEREPLLAVCTRVDIARDTVLAQPGDAIGHVYFPIDSVISLAMPLDGAARLEIGSVGNEGMLGISLLLGVAESPLRALVQSGGQALRIGALRFARELARSPALNDRLKRYAYLWVAQVARTATCTRFHLLEARVARWLLAARDRERADELRVTHASLALLLGVRRVGVTVAAGALQARQLIRGRRGAIRILDRRGLEAAACGCYRAAKAMHERILG